MGMTLVEKSTDFTSLNNTSLIIQSKTEYDETSDASTRKWVICLPNATQRSFLPPCLSCQSLVRWALHLFSSRRDGRRRRLYQTAPSVSPTLILPTLILISSPDKFNQIVGEFLWLCLEWRLYRIFLAEAEANSPQPGTKTSNHWAAPHPLPLLILLGFSRQGTN